MDIDVLVCVSDRDEVAKKRKKVLPFSGSGGGGFMGGSGGGGGHMDGETAIYQNKE